MDATSFLSTGDPNFLLHTGTTVSTLSYQPNAISGTNMHWMIYNGAVFSDGESIPPGTVDVYTNVYQWTPANIITDLSTVTQPQNAAPSESLIAVHDGWALWAASTAPGTTVLEFYNLTTGQALQVPNPSGATAATGDGSFYLSQGNLVLYYSAVGATGIYSWSQATNASTLIAGSTGQYPQTDGVRVAWQTDSSSGNCPNLGGCTLSALTIGSGAIQTVSQSMATFQLSGGLLAWSEKSTAAGGLKVSDGATTTVLSSQTTAQLFGVGTGYVLYEDNGFMNYWSPASGAQTLFNAVPRQAYIAGKTVYFTSGSTANAVYQMTLP